MQFIKDSGQRFWIQIVLEDHNIALQFKPLETYRVQARTQIFTNLCKVFFFSLSYAYSLLHLRYSIY